jgi:hypothetical protein
MKIRHVCFLFAMFAVAMSLSAQPSRGFTLFRPSFGIGMFPGWSRHDRGPSFRGSGGFLSPALYGYGWAADREWGSSWIPDDTLPGIGPDYPWMPFWDFRWDQSRRNYRSADFVERWRDWVPDLDAGDSGLDRSTLLSKGMDAEAVLRLLGSPIRRDRLGETEVWRYSSYALIFEGERLVKIR